MLVLVSFLSLFFVLERNTSYGNNVTRTPQDCPLELSRFLERTGASVHIYTKTHVKKLIASFESPDFAKALSELPRVDQLRDIEIWFTSELLGDFDNLSLLIKNLIGVENLRLWCYRANQDLLGFKEFGDGLAQMPSLKKLFLSMAPIQEEEVLALFDGLKHCLQLEEMELHSSAFDTLSYSACLRIADIVTHLQSNGALRQFVLKLPRNLMKIKLPASITEPRDVFAFNLAIIRQRPIVRPKLGVEGRTPPSLDFLKKNIRDFSE